MQGMLQTGSRKIKDTHQRSRGRRKAMAKNDSNTQLQITGSSSQLIVANYRLLRVIKVSYQRTIDNNSRNSTCKMTSKKNIFKSWNVSQGHLVAQGQHSNLSRFQEHLIQE